MSGLNFYNMDPTHNIKKELSRDEDEYYGIKVDRKVGQSDDNCRVLSGLWFD